MDLWKILVLATLRLNCNWVSSDNETIYEEKSGFEHHLASIRATPLSVEDFAKDPQGGQKALLEAGRKAVAEDRAEALLLGCAGMTNLEQRMEEALGVPVIDGVAAAVKLAESLVELSKKTSKINSYKYPEKKEFKGMEPIFQP